MPEKYTLKELIKASGLTKTKPTKAEIFNAIASKCVNGKILNPNSGRCVDINGPTGKSVIEKLSASCPSDKIINFTTGRCVLKSGSIGKKIIGLGSKKSEKQDYMPVKEGTTIYTKEGCGYCTKAKKLFTDNDISVDKEILVTDENKKKIYRKLDKYTNNYRYFPMIFWDGEFHGGYNDLLADLGKNSDKIVVPNPKYSNTSKFIGSVIQGFTSLVYLRTKHKESCVTIPLLANYTRELKDYENSSYLKYYSLKVVIKDKKNVEVIGSTLIIESLRKCMKNDKVRFIIIPVVIIARTEDSGHANMLIFDKTHNELERFEPHGFSLPKQNWFANEKIDKVLNKKMKEYIPSIRKYYPPISYCPYLGPQSEAELGNLTPGADKARGYCAAWSIWYADVRLSNPDSTRDEALAYALKVTRENEKGIKNYIRSYSQFLKNFELFLRNSRDPSKIIDKYIEEGFKS